MVLLQRKLYFFHGSRGGPIFSRSDFTCEDPEGGWGGPDPLSPLWILTCEITQYRIWRCASISAIPAGMVSHYQLCLLVWCLTISHACLCGASL